MSGRRFPIQALRDSPDAPRSIPWRIAEQAYREYARLYGTSQGLERLAERGGFAWEEIGMLLAGDIEQHGSERARLRERVEALRIRHIDNARYSQAAALLDVLALLAEPGEPPTR